MVLIRVELHKASWDDHATLLAAQAAKGKEMPGRRRRRRGWTFGPQGEMFR